MSPPARKVDPKPQVKSAAPSDVRAAVNMLTEGLKRSTDSEISLTDLIALAELMASSLQPMLRRVDVTLNRELRGILTRIENLRRDIAKVRADDISANRLPEMGRELHAVVSATESATNAIMSAAEAVLAADPDDKAYADLVSDRMMEIFEACSFQDLTGQRVSKVVQTVEVIEERINLLCAMLDSQGIGAVPAALTEEEQTRARRMMHGPSMAGEGVNQADIDKLF